MVYMAIYLFMSVAAFAVILCMRRGGKMIEEISDLAGLAKTQPVVAGALAIAMFSMAGIPHMQHLRSFSLAGLSDVKMIFDDESINDWNREKVLERLSEVTLPANLQPQIGSERDAEATHLADRLGTLGEQVRMVVDHPMRTFAAASFFIGQESQHDVAGWPAPGA